jgi:hypothetical protein
MNGEKQLFKRWTRISKLLNEGVDAITQLRPKSGMGGRREKTAGPPGVYCFRISHKKFSKLKKHLTSDILTIGHTSDLTYRLGVFIGAAQGFALWHSAGKKLYHARGALGFTVQDVEYSYIRVLGNPKSKGNLEKRLELEKKATELWKARLGSAKENGIKADRARIAPVLKKAKIKMRWNIVLPILMTNAPGRKHANHSLDRSAARRAMS